MVLRRMIDLIRSKIAAVWHGTGGRRLAFALSLVAICVPVNVVVWFLWPIHDWRSKLTVNVFAGFVPVLELMSERRALRFRIDLLYAGAFSIIVLAMAVGDRYGWQWLSWNALFGFMALPWCFMVWEFVGRNLLVLASLLAALLLTMVYWAATPIVDVGRFDLLLLPLPLILFGGVVWGPAAAYALRRCRQEKYNKIAGPGMQVVAMVVLFFPIMAVAATMLGLAEIWSAASLTVLGVLLSAVVGEPLRRFLLAWGRLTPYGRGDG